jgi:hypothetical protein
MNIVHAIKRCTHEPLVLVFAGGSHIDQISSLVESLGCKILLKTSAATVPALKKVLNSENVSTISSGMHPQPLDMHLLDTFIP